jgi:DNA-binding NarL/FixJ family response regulator
MTTPDRSPALTRREGEILALVARGLAAKQVARHLGISAKTVEQHKSNIFSKLGVANQTAAVSLVLGNGYAKRQQWIPSST